MTPPVLPPLTGDRWLRGSSLDVPVLVAAAVLGALYLAGVRRVRGRGGAWPGSWTAAFLLAGLGPPLLVTCSVLGTYDRVLFWAAAAQDVLLLTLVPVGLTLGRPLALLRAVRGPVAGPTAPGLLARLVGFPLVGSVVAVGTLLSVYTTGWDPARLEHPWLFALTQGVLVAVGCLFVWPLLGVDSGTGSTSYPVRALVAFLDGLLDAVPGLAVLATGHLVAAGWYASVSRPWGPSRAQDQQLGGTLMVALSELVGAPALLVLLVQWVRTDGREAAAVDAVLDAPSPRDRDGGGAQRPWWEVDPGPLADRAARQGWGGAPTDEDGPGVS